MTYLSITVALAIRFCVTVLATLTTATWALAASCSSDMRLHNDVVAQYNALTESGCAQSGTQQALVVSLLQQALALAQRLKACPALKGGSSPAEILSMIERADENNRACLELERRDAELEAVQAAILDEVQRLRAESDRNRRIAGAYRMGAAAIGLEEAGGAINHLEAAARYREAARVFGEEGQPDMESMMLAKAEAAEEAARGQSQPRTPKESYQNASEQCERALAYANQLNAAGQDVSTMRKSLSDAGCK